MKSGSRQKPELQFEPRAVVKRAGRMTFGSVRLIVRLLLLLGGLTAAGAAVTYLQPPRVELSWIDEGGSVPTSSPLDSSKLAPVLLEDLYYHRARFPLPLGIRSRELWRLDDVAVSIFYDSRLGLVSEAPQLIPAGDSTLAFEHQIGALDPGSAYRPLADRDLILVPVDSLLAGAFVVADDTYPEYVEFLKQWSGNAGDTSDVLIGITLRVTCALRRPLVIHLKIPLWLGQREWWPPRLPASATRVNTAEARLFGRIFAPGLRGSLGGTLHTKTENHKVDFAVGNLDSITYVRYAVDDVPRRALLDTNRDGYVDFELISSDANGEPDEKLVYGVPRPMDIPLTARLRPPLALPPGSKPSRILGWSPRP